jgi:hypothetical protein
VAKGLLTWTLGLSMITVVPDHESRDRDVILIRRTIYLGKPRGVGKLEWGGIGEGEVSLRATWGQGGRDRTTLNEGFQVSKREWKGN